MWFPGRYHSLRCPRGRESLEGSYLVDSVNSNDGGGRLGVRVGVHAEKTIGDLDLLG